MENQTQVSQIPLSVINVQPSKIQMLASDVVDQIAAGEVVERPAQLVKELIENAIDAGAKAVEIEFDQGGRRVRVTDDGGGIPAGDLRLVLARHATSKITTSDDLWQLASFGFRGEALASIAAVSRLTLQSRVATSDTASQVTSNFGTISPESPSAGNIGTSVSIEELFTNVPARLKFMKSESAESSQIKATVRALALANEGIEFRLRTKGKLESLWPRATSFLERAKQVLGLEKLYENQFEYDGFKSHVVYASPHEVAGNARNIQIFVQGRWVQDRGLQAAVVEAYRGLLMHGEFPIAVVRLEAPRDEVDVNIHPTKSQIKFRDPQPAFRAVNRALRGGLEQAPWLERAPLEVPAPEPLPTRKMSVAELTRQYQAANPAPGSATSPAAEAPTLATAPVHSTGRFEAPEFNAVVYRKKEDASERIEAAVEKFAAAAIPTPQKTPGAWSRLQVVGQAHLTYIMAQDANKLILIDQHAAHERVAYERLMRAWKAGETPVQNLLLPLKIGLESDGVEALMGLAQELMKLGVGIDQLGPTTIAVHAKPALVSDAALVKSLEDLGREIVERGDSFVLETKIGDLCATMACHSVVRAGQSLSTEQMRKLLEQMDEFPLSSFCPHGRPVSIEFPFAKLERDFGRTV